MRRSNPGSSGSISVRISGRPHLEQEGLRLSTNLYLGASAIALQSPIAGGDLGAFSQPGEAVPLDSRYMDEDILAAAIGLNKSNSLAALNYFLYQPSLRSLIIAKTAI